MMGTSNIFTILCYTFLASILKIPEGFCYDISQPKNSEYMNYAFKAYSGKSLVNIVDSNDTEVHGNRRGYTGSTQPQPTIFYYEQKPGQNVNVGQKPNHLGFYQRDSTGSGYSGGHGVDSYGGAALISPSSSYGVPMHSGGWGPMEEEEGSSFDLSGLSGLIGLLGLKGLKGVKGLKALGVLLPILPFILPILLALLLPILLAPILLPLLVILLFPIPVIAITPPTTGTGTGPTTGGGRSSNDSFSIASILANSPQIAQDVLDSEQCVERVACEVARIFQQSATFRIFKSSSWMDKLTNNWPKSGRYMTKIKHGLKLGGGGEYDDNSFKKILDRKCVNLSCNAVAIFSKVRDRLRR